MLKINLKKAYDSVEWSFLETIMSEIGFPTQFVKWVMACVSLVSFSILINDVPFHAQRGLRQGDPMSLFLFILGMKYLSRCLGHLKTIPNFNFHHRCDRFNITGLIFADDLLMLSRANPNSLSNLCLMFLACFLKILVLMQTWIRVIYILEGSIRNRKISSNKLLICPLGTFPFKYLVVSLTISSFMMNASL